MSERDLLKKALEALRPYTAMSWLDAPVPPDFPVLTKMSTEVSIYLEVGDFRRARAVHAEIKAALDSDAAPAREQNPSNDMASDKRCPYGSREG